MTVKRQPKSGDSAAIKKAAPQGILAPVDQRPRFSVAEWRDRLRSDQAKIRTQQIAPRAAVLRGFAGIPGLLEFHATRVAAGTEVLARMRAVLQDRSLDDVWKLLASHEIAWMSIDPRRAPYEALSRVVRELCDPPSVISGPPTGGRVDKFASALRRLLLAYKNDPAMVNLLPDLSRVIGPAEKALKAVDAFSEDEWRGPLIPATMPTKTGLRNWAALNLRDQVFPRYFEGSLPGAIARLIETAYPACNGRSIMTESNVRKLVSGNVRKSRDRKGA